MPTLLGRPDEVDALIRQIELPTTSGTLTRDSASRC